MSQISYRKLNGYKYELARDYCHSTEIQGYEILTPFLAIDKTGLLFIKKGYAWDGASGPTFDSKCTIRGSLIHDSIYQLIRLKLLPHICKQVADNLLHDICVEDGMSNLRADIWLKMVRLFGDGSCEPGSDNGQEDKVYIAP